MTSAVRRFVAIVAASVVCVLLANAVLFFTPLYARVVDPASSTGMLDRAVAQLAAWPADRRRDVLVLGDSRIYGGFNPALADAAGHGLRFLNAGVPGMTPRTWYYLDRAIDPHADRYRAIVIPIDSYGDDTSAIGSLDADDHPSDFRAVVFETTFRDIPKLATSFDGGDRERAMAVDLALRGPLLRYDVQDLLDDPEARVSALRAPPADTFSPQAAHPFTTQLTGLRVDFRAGTIASPAWIGPEEHRELERQILPVPQYSAMYARYRQRWLGPIVARYRATHTPVVFVRIPARPVHRAPPPRPSGTLVAFARDGGVVLLQQGPYVALERPELFADHDHLDVAGARRFSTQLGRDVAAALATFPVATTRAVAGAAAPAAAAAHERRERTGDALGIGAPILVQSYDYVLFLAIVAVLFYALPRRWKPMVLVVASYYFYARWNAWYVVLLAAITVSDFVIGIALERAPVRRRGMLLAIGVGANLAFLGTFKYTNFITANLAAMLGYHGDPWLLELLIPVGISFHTFQSISYLVDVTRRNVKPATNLVDYALYIAFFPQLLSGPIVRAAQFFAELGEWRPPNVDKVERGVREIVLGLVKKLVIADQFAPIANAYFSAVDAHPGAPAAWSAVFAFTIQIYFDFSGYSDIAIGSARLLGFDFPDNFDRPYLAASIAEFWRRWHISLSTWLRDYLYIPLGGSRRGLPLTLRNLMLTMLLGGLWHGASWTFVAWGGYHGALLCAHRLLAAKRNASPKGVVRLLGMASTFVLVMIGWVFFRAESFAVAFHVLLAMVAGGPGPAPALAWPLIPVAAALAIGVAQERGARWSWRRIPVVLQVGAATAMLLVLELCSSPGLTSPFIYFRF